MQVDPENVRVGPVLLVDDIMDSRRTLPMALADAGG